MSSNMKKRLSLITSFAVAFVMCLGCMGFSSSQAYAVIGNADLEVYYNDTLCGEFYYDQDEKKLYYYQGETKKYIDDATVDDDSTETEGDTTTKIKYSAMNNKGNSDNTDQIEGPNVLDIIAAANINYSTFNKQLITFVPGDEYPAITFTWSNLFDPNRSYYPNERIVSNGDNGAAVEPEELQDTSTEKVKKVPVIIDTRTIKKKVLKGQLSFGQLSPSERTKPNFQQHMIKVDSNYMPQIRINDVSGENKIDNIPEDTVTVDGVKVANGADIAKGMEITFGGEENYSPYSYNENNSNAVMYYDTEGNEPNLQSPIYNWYKFQDQDTGLYTYKYREIKANETGPLTIKTKVYSFDMDPSVVGEFNYNVVEKINLNNYEGAIKLEKDRYIIGDNPKFKVTIKNGGVEQVVDSKNYTVEYANNKSIGTGTVTVTGQGFYEGTLSATYTVYADFTKNKAVLTLNKTKVAAGTKPTVKVTVGKTTINKKYYTTTIPNTKKVGKYKATVKGKDHCSGTLTKAFTVIPAKAKFKSVTAGKKKATVVVVSQKASGVTKYQIKYKKASSKTWKTTTTTSTKKVIKKLKKGKKYNFKVRAYGKTGYGAFSAVKTIKIK